MVVRRARRERARYKVDVGERFVGIGVRMGKIGFSGISLEERGDILGFSNYFYFPTF
uniref:Uncharacterized protein n=1 Tax=Arundo donax TaxID=35708 RepID=A0A0A9BV38_ARUDO